jgi:hypothetical protein
MTTFEEREKSFESQFKHDRELQFKVKARRNRLLGLWAAERMGLAGVDAQVYAAAIVEAQFEPGGDRHVIAKVAADLHAKGSHLTESQVKFQCEHLETSAKHQIVRE